jgi:hypothetical protein
MGRFTTSLILVYVCGIAASSTIEGNMDQPSDENRIFLNSTPLHSLWSLGIAAASLNAKDEFWLIDKPSGSRDLIYEALQHDTFGMFENTIRFNKIGKSPVQKIARARAVVRSIKNETLRVRPTSIFIGNDKRIEFHAALNAYPTAKGVYLDDGTASYTHVPEDFGDSENTTDILGNLYRRVIYGIWTPRNSFLGTTKAITEAHLLIPELAHAVLAKKTLHHIKPEWFRDERVVAVCTLACELAQLDVDKLASAKLLLCLPNDKLFVDHPYISEAFEKIAASHIQKGGTIALKKHPRSETVKLDIDPRFIVEIPQELPLEIVAPLLEGSEVLGVATSSLIYLKVLGTNVGTTTLVPKHIRQNAILEIYRKLGITELAI